MEDGEEDRGGCLEMEVGEVKNKQQRGNGLVIKENGPDQRLLRSDPALSLGNHFSCRSPGDGPVTVGKMRVFHD